MKKSNMSEMALYSKFEIVEDDELSSLGSPLWMEMDLERIIDWMVSETVFTRRDPVTGNEVSYIAPRFGVYSTLLANVPCYLYGDPELVNRWGNTAFTDGLHIFIHTGFYQQLVNDEDESQGRERGVVILLLHELSHILNEDVYRLTNYSRKIANIAQDYIHNTTMILGFPDLKFARSLIEYGVGFAPGDIEKYPYLSQEIVAEELFNKERKEEEEESPPPLAAGNKSQKNNAPNNKDEKEEENSSSDDGENEDKDNNKKDKSSNKGKSSKNKSSEDKKNDTNKKSSGEESSDGSDDSDDGEEEGDESGDEGSSTSNESESGKGKSKKSKENIDKNGRIKFGSEDDDHHHTLEEVIKALEDMKLEGVMEKLNLPKSTDKEAIKEKQNMGIDIKNQSIIEADNKRHELSMPGFPGEHMLNCAMERIKSVKKGKLTWKMKVIDEIWGTGLNFKYNNDIIGDIYFVDEMIDVIGMNLYVGQITPFKSNNVVAVIIDTSMSVGQKDLEDIIPEIIEMKVAAESGSGAYEVLVFSADTVLRGVPIEITSDNVHEFLEGGLQIFGRGGTNLTTAINQTVKSEVFKDKKIKSLIYFTDLGDYAPQYKDLELDPDTSVTYIAVPSIQKSLVEHFAEQVKDYAEVIKIREDQEVDLSITPRLKQENMI